MNEKKFFFETQKIKSAYEDRRRRIIDSAVEKLSGPPSPEQDEEVIKELEIAREEYMKELMGFLESQGFIEYKGEASLELGEDL